MAETSVCPPQYSSTGKLPFAAAFGKPALTTSFRKHTDGTILIRKYHLESDSSTNTSARAYGCAPCNSWHNDMATWYSHCISDEHIREMSRFPILMSQKQDSWVPLPSTLWVDWECKPCGKHFREIQAYRGHVENARKHHEICLWKGYLFVCPTCKYPSDSERAGQPYNNH